MLTGRRSGAALAHAAADGIRFVRRPRHPRSRRAGEPHPRRGSPRRRARREGLGRRPQGRRRRGRIPAEASTTCSAACARRAAAARPSLRRSGRSPRGRLEGNPHRRATVARSRIGRHIRIVGHPYVDVWQCVTPADRASREMARRPARRSTSRSGVSRPRLAADTRPTSPGRGSGSSGGSRSYGDLDPALLGRVEELIDFVTAEDTP